MAVRIGVIGAGHMAHDYHCPSLAYLARLKRPRVSLEAICDLKEPQARKMARKFGFADVYGSVGAMLSGADLDGVCVITPTKATAEVATAVMNARIPVYMEKPPGASLAEAQGLAKTAARTGTPSMVAFNRRFGPAVLEARRRAAELGEPTYFEAVQLRGTRLEPRFVRGTGLHVIDAIRFIGGDVVSVACEKRRGASEGTHTWMATLDFASGATGRVLIKPHSGCNIERFTVSSAKYTIFTGGGTDWLADYPGTLEVHIGGKVKRPRLPKKRVKISDKIYWSGFYGEMTEFVESIEKERLPHPTTAEAVQSVKLAQMMDAGRSGRL